MEEEGEECVAIVLENEKLYSSGVGRLIFFHCWHDELSFWEDGKQVFIIEEDTLKFCKNYFYGFFEYAKQVSIIVARGKLSNITELDFLF